MQTASGLKRDPKHGRGRISLSANNGRGLARCSVRCFALPPEWAGVRRRSGHPVKLSKSGVSPGTNSAAAVVKVLFASGIFLRIYSNSRSCCDHGNGAMNLKRLNSSICKEGYLCRAFQVTLQWSEQIEHITEVP